MDEPHGLTDSTLLKKEMNRMEEINVEEFKRNIKGSLDRLPFVVTRRGKPLFVCVKPDHIKKDEPILQPEPKKAKQPKIDPCKDMSEPAKEPVASPGEGKVPIIPINKPVYACNYFNPQPKAIPKQVRHVPVATRAPNKPIDTAIVPGLLQAMSKDKPNNHAPNCICAMCKR